MNKELRRQFEFIFDENQDTGKPVLFGDTLTQISQRCTLKSVSGPITIKVQILKKGSGSIFNRLQDIESDEIFEVLGVEINQNTGPVILVRGETGKNNGRLAVIKADFISTFGTIIFPKDTEDEQLDLFEDDDLFIGVPGSEKNSIEDNAIAESVGFNELRQKVFVIA